MISKEDIIRRWFKKNGHDYESEISIYQGYAIYSAMEEWGKEMAIGFANWMQRYVLHYYGKDPYRFIARQQPQGGRHKPEEYTIEQLFQSYLNQLHQNI